VHKEKREKRKGKVAKKGPRPKGETKTVKAQAETKGTITTKARSKHVTKMKAAAHSANKAAKSAMKRVAATSMANAEATRKAAKADQKKTDDSIVKNDEKSAKSAAISHEKSQKADVKSAEASQKSLEGAEKAAMRASKRAAKAESKPVTLSAEARTKLVERQMKTAAKHMKHDAVSEKKAADQSTKQAASLKKLTAGKKQGPSGEAAAAPEMRLLQVTTRRNPSISATETAVDRSVRQEVVSDASNVDDKRFDVDFYADKVTEGDPFAQEEGAPSSDEIATDPSSWSRHFQAELAVLMKGRSIDTAT